MTTEERVAEVLLSELEYNGLDDMGFDVDHAAAAVLAALNLTEERREVIDKRWRVIGQKSRLVGPWGDVS